jgi:hypothetical protein
MISSIHDVNCGLFPMLGRTGVLPIALDMISLTGADAGETIEDILKTEGIDEAFKDGLYFAGQMGYDLGSLSHSSFTPVAWVRGRIAVAPALRLALFVAHNR